MVMVVLQERSSVLVAPLLVGWRLEFLMAVVVQVAVFQMVMVVLQERSSVLVAPLLVGWRLEFLMAVVVGILVVDSLTRMVDFLLKAVAQSFLGTLLVLPMV